MDKSKKYILMCEKAEEIQEEWKPKRGDFYTVVVHGKATDIINVYIDGFPSLPQRFIPLSELYIWLPRQDQLQEMIFPSKDLGFEMDIAELYTWIDKENNERRIYRWLRSWEQLWLAFVMKEKHKKTWDGKEWVKKE